MTESPGVVTVVVTFNSAATISACLRHLEASSVPSRIVVVDNASSDETKAVVSRDFPDVTVVANPKNTGFAVACNVGMAAAATSAPAYFLFVNPDAYVEPPCLSALLDAMEANPIAAVASPLILSTSTGAIWYAGAAGDVERGIYWHLGVGDRDEGQYTTTVETGRPTGCVMLARATAVQTVGPMDASYFLYWEDVEWAMRFRAHGLSVLFVPAARSRHDVSTTTGGPTSKVYEYYYLRNRLRLVHDTSRLTRRQLIAANWRGSAETIAVSFRTRGLRDGLRATRAITLAYVDFARERYGQFERL
jgi:GT2 family glycosyltransferase